MHETNLYEETVDDEDPGDVVLNPKDIQMLERFHLGKDNEEDTEPLNQCFPKR